MILALSTLVWNGCAYLYSVACIRYLGARAYGDIAALLALGALVAIPLGSVQIVIAREVAHLGSQEAAGLLLRRLAIRLCLVGLGLFALGLILVAPIQDLLRVDSRAAVVAGLSALVFAIVAAGLFGVLQGALRFEALGWTYVVGGIARVALVVPALLLGFGVVGALTVAGQICLGIDEACDSELAAVRSDQHVAAHKAVDADQVR